MALDGPLPPPTIARRRLMAPAILAAIVLLLLGGGGIAAFFVAQSAGSDAPPRPGAFVVPAAGRPVALFDVREANGAVLTLLPANIDGEALTVTFAAGTAIEALVPASPSVIAPGHW